MSVLKKLSETATLPHPSPLRKYHRICTICRSDPWQSGAGEKLHHLFHTSYANVPNDETSDRDLDWDRSCGLRIKALEPATPIRKLTCHHTVLPALDRRPLLYIPSPTLILSFAQEFFPGRPKFWQKCRQRMALWRLIAYVNCFVSCLTWFSTQIIFA